MNIVYSQGEDDASSGLREALINTVRPGEAAAESTAPLCWQTHCVLE